MSKKIELQLLINQLTIIQAFLTSPTIIQNETMRTALSLQYNQSMKVIDESNEAELRAESEEI